VPKRFLVVGEVNADVIVQGLPHLPVMGREILCRNVERVMGGSSAIFACRLATLGADVSFLGVVGDDPDGRLMLDWLAQAGVDTSLVQVDARVATGATYVLSFPHDRAMFTHLGSIGALTPERISLADLDPFDHIHFSSPFVQTGMTAGMPDLLATVRALGPTISLDPQWDPTETWPGFREMARSVVILLPNDEEARSATGLAETAEAARELAAWTPGVAVVKRGAEGALAWHDDGLIATPAPSIMPIDTTGAGDTFDAAFVKRFVDDAMPLADSLRYAATAGAIACTQLGGAVTPLAHQDVIREMEERA
jgi:sugar/nucleoside kinase (ribokinase family)